MKFDRLHLILTAICSILLMVSSYLIFNPKEPIYKEVIKTETDTVTITNTDTIKQYITKTITKPIPIKETIIKYDTLYNAPQSIKTYEDSITTDDNAKVAYKAVVSGYRQSLDTIEFNVRYPQITNTITNTITNEKTITKYKSPRITFGVGIGTGYGILNKKSDIFIGASLNYTIFAK